MSTLQFVLQEISFHVVYLAVDMWSAGVILLCLLTGKYPFFRCADDMTALAQIMTVFGKQRVVESAKLLGKFIQVI